MAGSAATVRQAIATSLAALPGWTQSRWVLDEFGADTDHTLHHTFVVRIGDTTAHQPEGRQRASEGLWSVESPVLVLWAHRLRGDSQVADYDAALDAEQLLVKAIKAVAGLHILIEQMSRRAGPEGFVLGQVRLRVVHNYALT